MRLPAGPKRGAHWKVNDTAPYRKTTAVIVRLGSCTKRWRSHQAYCTALFRTTQEGKFTILLTSFAHDTFKKSKHNNLAFVFCILYFVFLPDGLWGPPILVSIQWKPEARLHGRTAVWTKNLAIRGSTSCVPRSRNCISCVPRWPLQVYQLRPAVRKELHQLHRKLWVYKVSNNWKVLTVLL